MAIQVKFDRNWNRVGRLFEFELPEQIDNSIEQAIDEASQVYSDAILDILAEQPSDWTPKSEGWARRSGSEDLYYGETGSFVVAVASPEKNQRGIRAKRGDKRVFVGARHDIRHHSGYTMEQIAGILQSIPDGSRDLFGRAYERVEDRITQIFRNIHINLK